MMPKASGAAVNAVMRTLGCERGALDQHEVCLMHLGPDGFALWTDRGCPVAVATADAAVDADRASIQAETLREAARDVPLFEFMLVMDEAAEVAPGQIGAWLRARADRIETQP
jgi:hypothetical protein